jgi:hypothetical protein
MLIPFGILSAAGAGVGVAGDYELIETSILTSSASSVTFSNLGTYSSTYKHLQIRQVARATTNTTSRIRLNGDTGTNYARHVLLGNGSTVGSFAATSASAMGGITVVNTANVFSGGITDILDAYSTTKNTTIRQLSGVATTEINLFSGVYLNTASISSITILLDGAGSFEVGSRFSLYGIRG